MEYRPSRSFIILMSVFTACGVAGAWGWNRMNSVPQDVRAKADLWKILTYKRPSIFEPPTPAEVACVKGEVEKMKAELVSTHPLLVIDVGTIPADRNAFLRLHLLNGPGEMPHKTVSRELATAMDKDNKATWDAARMRTLLEGHQELIAELRLIGGLRDRSSNGMPDDYTGFVSGREIVNQAKVLLHSAKLAALDGNPGQALNDVKCVTAMASHYQEVGGTNLLMTTIAILLDGFVREWVLEEMVPILGPDTDLQPWREILATRRYDPQLLAHALRGEWHYLTGSFVLPVLLLDRPDNPRDPKELMNFIADQFSDSVDFASKADLADLTNLPEITPSESSHLSKKSRELVKIFTSGWANWGNGFVRAAVRQQMGLAAIDLIIMERSGSAPSTAEVMIDLPKNPLDGVPFHYDRATRTISLSEKDSSESLRLPP